MANAETRYQARVAFPEMLERARAQTLQLDTFSAGAVSAPSSGTISIYDATNTAVVDGAAVTIPGNAAQYALSAATIPATLPLSTGWRVEWSLVMADGVTHTFRRDAWLVRRTLQIPITNQDLLDQYTDLSNLVASPTTTLETYIDSAWKMVLAKLVDQGILPQRIVSPWSLRQVMIDAACWIMFRDFHSTTSGEGKYLDLADEHRRAFFSGWKRLNFSYDRSGVGYDSTPDERTAGSGVVYLSRKPTSRRWVK